MSELSELSRTANQHSHPSPIKLVARTPSMNTFESHMSETSYVRMLKEEAQMDVEYNITASAANWILLAGYLVVPGTFTSLQNSTKVKSALETNSAGRAVLQTIQNPPLIVIACLFLAGGIGALAWLLHFPRLRSNYLWLVNKIFLPASMNAAAGLLTTLVNVYTSRGGHWSVMAIATTIVTGSALVVFSTLLVIYKWFKMKQVIREDRLASEG
ncbi:hypothetical protein N7490_006528 [Penicillium lividum]|nr:hypothetical protein N7490_006528 [Penicillium lividum]